MLAFVKSHDWELIGTAIEPDWFAVHIMYMVALKSRRTLDKIGSSGTLGESLLAVSFPTRCDG